MIHRIPENSYRNYIDTILPYNMVTLGYRSWRAKSWPIAKIVIEGNRIILESLDLWYGVRRLW
jgi:hypothetical protein